MTKTIASTPRNLYPGDTARIMSRIHTDINGTIYPQGTLYEPLSVGRDNAQDCDEQRVTIAGATVVF